MEITEIGNSLRIEPDPTRAGGGYQLMAEASQLNFQPGIWPDEVMVVMASGSRYLFLRGASILLEDSLLGYIYVSAGGQARMIVLND